MIYQANDILKEIKLKWQGLKIYCELLKNYYYYYFFNFLLLLFVKLPYV